MRLIAALGVAVFLIGIVVRFPARVALDWFAPETLQVSGVSGSVWRGEASALSAAGLYLTRVEWRLRPLSLLTASPSAELKASPANGFIETRVKASASGRVRLDDLTASIPLAMLADAARTPGLAGSASLRFEYLELRDGFPASANGSIDIGRLQVPPVFAGSLGDYRLEFNDLDDGVIASIEDVDGVIDVAGTLTLSAGRSYSLLAQIAATRSTPQELARRIDFLPAGRSPGMKEVRLEGTL